MKFLQLKKNIQFQKIGNNDVALSSEIIACESSSKGLNSMVASARTFDDISNDVTDKAQLVNTEIHDPPMQIASAADALKVGERENLSLVMSSKYPFENETLMDHDSVPILASKSSEVVDFNSKPRTALFQGGEDDEHMAPQIIDTENYYVNSNKSIGDFSKSSGIRFGGFYLVEKYIKRNKGICASDVPPSSILSIEANLRQKQEMKSRRFIHIGRVAVEINEA